MTSGLTEWGTMATRFSVVDISWGIPMVNWLAPWVTAIFSGRVSRLNPYLLVHCVMRRNIENTNIVRLYTDIDPDIGHIKIRFGELRPLDEA